MKYLSDKELIELLVSKEKELPTYCKESGIAVYAVAEMENSSGKTQLFYGINTEIGCRYVGNCAERNAMYSGIMQGYQKLKRIAVHSPKIPDIGCCGLCLEAIKYVGDRNTIIIRYDADGNVEAKPMSEAHL